MPEPLCQHCHAAPATWALQYVASDAPTFTTLGSHSRGFPVVKVCDACRRRVKDPERNRNEKEEK